MLYRLLKAKMRYQFDIITLHEITMKNRRFKNFFIVVSGCMLQIKSHIDHNLFRLSLQLHHSKKLTREEFMDNQRQPVPNIVE
jgi:hypothetical protein